MKGLSKYDCYSIIYLLKYVDEIAYVNRNEKLKAPLIRALLYFFRISYFSTTVYFQLVVFALLLVLIFGFLPPIETKFSTLLLALVVVAGAVV